MLTEHSAFRSAHAVILFDIAMETLNTSRTTALEETRGYDTEPDWSLFEPPNRSVLDIPEAESVLSTCIDYGLRPDGSRQIGVLYGAVRHSFESSSTVY